MEIEVVPLLPVPERTALVQALARAGVRLDGKPEAYERAWLRTAAREAVEAELPPARYARSPRSTRGAKRA